MTLPVEPLIEVIPLGEREKYDQVMLHHRLAHSHAAAFATELAKMSAFAPVPDNTLTPSGDQRYRTPTEQELVDRCVKIAELMYAKFVERGLTQPIPAFDTLRAEHNTPGFSQAKD